MPPKQTDKKTELTNRTVENLKASKSLFEDFVRSARVYQKTCTQMADASRGLSDSLTRVSQGCTGDIGQALMQLAEAQRMLHVKQEALNKAVAMELVNSVLSRIKPEEMELKQFQDSSAKSLKSCKANISKLTAASKGAGKKGGGQLQNSIQALNDAIKDEENLKSDILRNVLLLERKKYCGFLGSWIPVVAGQLDLSGETERMRAAVESWKRTAQSYQSLPQDLDTMLTAQTERTFVKIQESAGSSGFGGGGGGYDTGSSFGAGGGSFAPPAPPPMGGGYDQGGFDSYGGGGGGFDQGSSFGAPPPPPPAPAGGGGYVGSCTALYDYVGEMQEDLSFYAGSVINVTKLDDGSGWIEGELDGATGIFPASYVQMN